MQFFHITVFITPFIAFTSATAILGGECNGSKTYDCTSDFDAIAVCDGSKWRLAAQCGQACCVQPAGDPAPWCCC